ncbi:MAG TPA: hypothetical protein VFE37_07865 [Chloroflexota bacterium]|nr:hypothetical protein [Chloroflexota bacterium]
MSEPQRRASHSLSVHGDRPLIGVVVQEGDEEVVRYSADEQITDETARQNSIERALSLAGAWADLDWDKALEDLDRIRHASRPTPPIEL